MTPVLRQRSRAFSILSRVIFILLLFALVLLLFVYYIIRSSFPQTDGTVQIPGLRAPVTVYRDNYGIAQIYAGNLHDLFLAQGYVHAQERFWQMDVWRHTGSGRLSEMFGYGLLDTDRFLRTLGFDRIAKTEIEQSDDMSRAILTDYASGVNAYLKEHQGRKLSLEYALLSLQNRNYSIEPWNPVHSITWGKLMAWDLSENMDSEIGRARLTQVLSRDQIEQLYPPYPADHPVIAGMPDRSQSPVVTSLPPGSSRVIHSAATNIESLNEFLGSGLREGLGSNNWVISGKRTATGKPVLCNDPHLATQMPSIWYQIGLHCDPVGPDCPFDVSGFSFAGVPGIVIGHNSKIAWGFTNVGPDVQDLFVEKINPQNANQYEFNGEWHDMQIVPQTIAVAGRSPVEMNVRYTRHGPIISDSYKELADFSRMRIGVPANYAVALRWTALDASRIFQAIWKMNLAQNWSELREAASQFDVPSQNIVYADIDGNIGYQLPGKIPIRKNGNGRYPVPGWTGEYEWTGFIPFEELPSVFNPPSGYVVTANNAAAGKDYPYYLTSDWDYGFRAQRIVTMIEHSNAPLAVSDIQRMQYDNKNLNADALIPLLTKLQLNDDHLERARDLLKTWNGQQELNSAPAALFETFWKNLLAETFHDELPAQLWPSGGNRWVEIVRNLITQPDSLWWDNRKTSERENRDWILLTAFRKAVFELDRRFGRNTANWKWGELHTITYRNSTFGHSGIRLIEALFNRGPYPAAGGTAIVNATSWNATRSFEVTALPSMRMLVDLSNLDNSFTIHSPGQSGHAFHSHYNDLIDPWRTGKYYPMYWSRTSVEKNSKSVLRLVP